MTTPVTPLKRDHSNSYTAVNTIVLLKFYQTYMLVNLHHPYCAGKMCLYSKYITYNLHTAPIKSLPAMPYDLKHYYCYCDEMNYQGTLHQILIKEYILFNIRV